MGPNAPGYSQKQREQIYQQMNYVISELHKVDYKIGLEDFGKPGNYISRQISWWTRQYRASETEKIESIDEGGYLKTFEMMRWFQLFTVILEWII